MSSLTLAVILVAPVFVLGAVAFVLILAFMQRVSRVTAELEAKRQPPPASSPEPPPEPDSGELPEPPPGPDPPADH